MAIVRWDPFDAFLGVQEDLNRLFRRDWLRGVNAEGGLPEGGAWAPAIDIFETEGSLVVEAEVPGVDPKEISVTLDEGLLTLKGERKLEKEVKEENFYRVERAYGSFQRAIRMPAEVDPDKVKASYDNGVLKVTVEKVAPKKPRSVDIEVETRKEKK
jgi:HSP20 family protein